jgi:hypothetical protein
MKKWYLVKSRGRTLYKFRNKKQATVFKNAICKVKGFKGFGKPYIIGRNKLFSRDK